MLLPNMVLAAALVKLKLRAGVLFDVATAVVNNGLRVPAVKLVTVPEPPPPEPLEAKVIRP